MPISTNSLLLIMDEDRYLADLVLAIVGVLMLRRIRRRRRQIQRQAPQPQPPVRRRLWAQPWLLRREVQGDYDNLLWELHREDHKGFKSFIRISTELFEEMIAKIEPKVQKQDTRLRKALPVGLKLAVTLRFLSTGNTYSSLGFSFRTSTSAISRFVPLVCDALYEAYSPEFLKCPKTPEEWKEVANEFRRKWNYHHCCGALDGKHVPIKKPDHQGTLYYNYKKFHSIILMALADAKYRFLYVDVGAEGGAGDAGTWIKSTLCRGIEKEKVGFPTTDLHLPHDNQDIPYHIIGDDAFALKTWLMKPYAHLSQVHHERIFNYRLSRARRVVENAFGVLQMRWRVFGSPIGLNPKTVRTVTLCACVMHNLLLVHHPPRPQHLDREDYEGNFIPGEWRDTENLMERLMAAYARNPTRRAKAQRDYLALYFCSRVGAVPWQERIVYPRGRPAHVL